MDKRRSKMSPGRLMNKILEQALGVGLGQALLQANCVTQFPVPESYKLCKANGILLTMQEQVYSATLGKLCSTAETSSPGRLREKGKHHCLHFTEGETQTEGTGAASKFRADPPNFLTLRHFSWEHTIPHMLLMFSLQRMRILHFSA